MGLFWLNSGIVFSINFPNRLNLAICSKYNASTFFLTFQASHFSIKSRSTNPVFVKAVSWTFFLTFCRLFQKWLNLGSPSKSDGIQHGTKIYQVVQVLRNFLFPSTAFFQTLFSRSHSNYRVVGTSWHLKGHFFDGDWLIAVFVAFFCALFYTMFILFFIKHR